MTTTLTDHRVQVKATIDFWRSRFGKPPSPAEIAAHTGIPHSEVLSTLAVLDRPREAPRPPLAAVAQASATDPPDGFERLVCQECARTWTRRRVRGQKPRRCPSCR